MRLYNWRVNSQETVLDRTGRCPGSSLPSQWWEGEALLPSTLWHEVCQEETVLCSCIYSALWNKDQILRFLDGWQLGHTAKITIQGSVFNPCSCRRNQETRYPGESKQKSEKHRPEGSRALPAVQVCVQACRMQREEAAYGVG